MKTAERVVMVALLVALFGGVAWIYFAVQYNQAELRQAVADGKFEIPIEDTTVSTTSDHSGWRTYYPVTVPIVIGSTTMKASVAENLPDRIKGLSNTPYLPEDVVKLFVFGTEGAHSIWMKDMLYALDIIWVTKEGEIVHIEENVLPETYPESFRSPTPAWYVIEANAGFSEKAGISTGDQVQIDL